MLTNLTQKWCIIVNVYRTFSNITSRCNNVFQNRKVKSWYSHSNLGSILWRGRWRSNRLGRFWRIPAFGCSQAIRNLFQNAKISQSWSRRISASCCFRFVLFLLALPHNQVILPPHIPWVGQGGGILLLRYSMICVIGLAFFYYYCFWFVSSSTLDR